jgi:hypothetical protein
MAAAAVTSTAMAPTVPTAVSAAVPTFPVPVSVVPAAVVVVPMMIIAATAAPDIDASVAVRWCIAGSVSVSGIGVAIAGRICDAARQSGC